ncbi:MAG: DUF4190 domain-containing protein [Actinomycetota bacterium]
MGARYAIGTGHGFHGIWDKLTPGPPIERFPESDSGWNEALTRYMALEPGSAVPPPAVVAAAPAINAQGPGTVSVTAAAPGQTNSLAVASLVLGILWLWWIGSVLALIFGYAARSQIKRSGEAGSGLAIAGIVLGWVGIGTAILYFFLLSALFQGVSELNEQLSPAPGL